jgi:hypothetical protein
MTHVGRAEHGENLPCSEAVARKKTHMRLSDHGVPPTARVRCSPTNSGDHPSMSFLRRIAAGRIVSCKEPMRSLAVSNSLSSLAFVRSNWGMNLSAHPRGGA